MKRIYYFVTLLTCYVQSQTDLERIEGFIQEVMDIEEVPGLSIAVVNDGEPYLVKGFGVKNIYTEEPVDEHTLFYIASTGKAMTGTLLAKLIAENDSMTLDSPVHDILGSDFHLSEFYRTENVNSKDLLSHRVNIPASDFHHMLAEITDREELIWRNQFWEATKPFRGGFFYSNVMVTTAGVVAAKLSDISYEDAMRRELFEPLGMTNTTFLHQMDEGFENLVTPHQTDTITGRMDTVSMDAYRGAAAVAPSGGMVSSAADLVKWLQFQVNNGRSSDGQQIIDEETLEEIRKPHFYYGFGASQYDYKPYSPVAWIEDTYGLGWGLGNYRGYRMMQHGGALFGFWSNAMVLPDMKIGIFICVNGPDGFRSGDAMNKIKLFTADILLGKEPWVNATFPLSKMQESKGHSSSDFMTQESFVEEQRHYKFDSSIYETAKMKQSQFALPDYEGQFGHFAMGNISVVYNNDTDRLTAYFGEIGVFNLILVNDSDPVSHIFLAVAQEPFWFLPPVRTIFYINEETGTPDSFIVPIMLPENPPLFERDLDIGDAPNPPTDNCPLLNQL